MIQFSSPAFTPHPNRPKILLHPETLSVVGPASIPVPINSLHLPDFSARTPRTGSGFPEQAKKHRQSSFSRFLGFPFSLEFLRLILKFSLLFSTSSSNHRTFHEFLFTETVLVSIPKPIPMDSSPTKSSYGTKLSTFRKRRKLWISLSVLILVVLILLILGLTLFKPKHAIMTVNSVKVNGLRVALDVPQLRVDFNVSLDIDLTVENPNRVSFRYANSSAFLYYRGLTVGEVAIPAAKISSGEKKRMNVTLVLMADQLLSDSNFYSDIVSGTLPLKISTRISGKVIILKLFKHHVVSYTYCDVLVNVRNSTVGNSNCVYRTKL